MNHANSLPTGEIEFRFPRSRRTPSRARASFREQAALWKVRDEVTEAAELCVGELVANAVVHGKAPVGREVWVRCVVWQDGPLRIEVLDADEELPDRVTELPEPEAEGGRGLWLVGALADRWNAESRERAAGKRVWCEFDGACAGEGVGGSVG
ncbi:ATP-binding protein [Streptomyces sp. SID11385]|uniref:ATP-binding protein n=1 Tax=Streptomyces sp. SID11385 TaxID=2706031 RepID=UPI0013C89C2D|nr:ATP-binding protein [Streptomyces sp. SID11385]NEA39525.1 ATP-binding protein [Streptomyces sp. SID11385]